MAQDLRCTDKQTDNLTGKNPGGCLCDGMEVTAQSSDLISEFVMPVLGEMIRSLMERESARNNLPPFSNREIEVLQWMKEGKTNWEILRIAGIKERTVRYHVTTLKQKFEVTTRIQAVIKAMEIGLI